MVTVQVNIAFESTISTVFVFFAEGSNFYGVEIVDYH